MITREVKAMGWIKVIKSIEEVTELNLVLPSLDNNFQLITNSLYILLSSLHDCIRIM